MPEFDCSAILNESLIMTMVGMTMVGMTMVGMTMVMMTLGWGLVPMKSIAKYYSNTVR